MRDYIPPRSLDTIHNRTTVEPHTVNHALSPELTGCNCNMADIKSCVICNKQLAPVRDYVDTCGKSCTRKLLVLQRKGNI